MANVKYGISPGGDVFWAEIRGEDCEHPLLWDSISMVNGGQTCNHELTGSYFDKWGCTRDDGHSGPHIGHGNGYDMLVNATSQAELTACLAGFVDGVETRAASATEEDLRAVTLRMLGVT